MRSITDKHVQIVASCVCGATTVDQDVLKIKWRDLAKSGIRRKRDRSTGKTWLLHTQQFSECHCNDHDDY